MAPSSTRTRSRSTTGTPQVPWLPASGRLPVCRREGCSQPATDDTLRLCVEHEATYRLVAARTLALAGQVSTALRSLPA